MCDIGEFFRLIVTKPGTGGQEAQAQIDKAAALQSQQATQQQVAAALDAQKQAQATAAAASDTADAQAADALARRRRRAQDPGAVQQFFTAGTSAPALAATRTLFGS